MWPVRTLGGSTKEAAAGQVMCTGWIISIKIIFTEIQYGEFNFNTDTCDSSLKWLVSSTSGCVSCSFESKLKAVRRNHKTKEHVIPGVSWVDNLVPSHFSAALCCVLLSSYTDGKPDRGSHQTSPVPSLHRPLVCRLTDRYRICQ